LLVPLLYLTTNRRRNPKGMAVETPGTQ